MIRVAFTLANTIAKHFRFSPTAIVEGREQQHLEALVSRSEESSLQRIAQQQAFNAKLQNITCPFQKEKEQIVAEFANPQSNLAFAEAWLKIDEVEQRQSDQILKQFSQVN